MFRENPKYTYIPLLASMLALFAVGPFVSPHPFLRFSLTLLLMAVLLSGIYAVSHSRTGFWIALALGGSSFLLELFRLTTGNERTALATLFLELPYFAFITGVMFKHLLHQRKVSGDTIYGAICVYLLIGLMWSFVYLLLESLAPGSFSGSLVITTPDGAHASSLLSGFIYFSFVTLTTLGYGDIVPIHPGARMLAILEGAVGQMYIAILVARLVALHVFTMVQENSPTKS